MDFRRPQNISIGPSVPMPLSIQQEDRMYLDKTQLLMKRLNEIEKKSSQMRKETERLRKLKDEAKQKVKENFPHIFKSDIHGIVDITDSNHIRFTEHELETSDTSISSGDMTRSEGDETASRFGERYKFGHLPRNISHMSKEMQEVYSTLVASNQFDNNRSDSSDPEGSKKLKKRINGLKHPKEVSLGQQYENKDGLHTGPLGHMLKNFNRQQFPADGVEYQPSTNNIPAKPVVSNDNKY